MSGMNQESVDRKPVDHQHMKKIVYSVCFAVTFTNVGLLFIQLWQAEDRG
jgi:uncharacterized membrane protein YiaA